MVPWPDISFSFKQIKKNKSINPTKLEQKSCFKDLNTNKSAEWNPLGSIPHTSTLHFTLPEARIFTMPGPMALQPMRPHGRRKLRAISQIQCRFRHDPPVISTHSQHFRFRHGYTSGSRRLTQLRPVRFTITYVRRRDVIKQTKSQAADYNIPHSSILRFGFPHTFPSSPPCHTHTHIPVT